MPSRHLRTAAAALGLLSATLLTGCQTLYLPGSPPVMAPPTVTVPAAPTVTVPVPETRYASPPTRSVRTTGCVASYRTAQSSVDICGSSGSLYYYGSSGSGSITLRAYPDGDGYTTESNDGHVYSVDSSSLTITRYGSTISSQPVLSASGG